jgi:hypothetical protein
MLVCARDTHGAANDTAKMNFDKTKKNLPGA